VRAAAVAAIGLAAMSAGAARAGEIREKTLENGLRVIVREDRAKDLVALSLHVDGGNRTEPRELSGLSHYYEHLIFRGGTARQKELETRKVFMSLGDFSGYTTQDWTAYNFVAPRERFDEALWRFADAVVNVDVTAEKVAKEREVVLSEYKMSYADNPSGWAWYNLARTAFARHPYGRTTIGIREVIENPTLEKLRSFYAERYVPNHMVVAVVGAISPEDAFEKVGRAFAARPRGKPSFETGEAEPDQVGPRVALEAKKTEKSYADLGFKAPAVLAEDAYAVRVLAQVLGGGAASRLETEVRAKKGLALEASAWFDETKDPGLLGVALTLEPGREVEAVAAVADEAARLGEEDVPEDELERAKSALANAWTLGNESYLAQAEWITKFAIWGDPRLGEDAVARVRAVAARDVRRAARRYLASPRATVSVVHPEGRPAIAEAALLAAIMRIEPVRLAKAGLVAPGARPERTTARRLTSGVRAIVREDFSAPVVAAALELGSPLGCEPPGKPGVAALGERLLARGADALSREELGARIDALGIRLDTAFDFDDLAVTLDAPAAAFADGLALLGDVALRPRFAEDEIEKARAEQVAAIEAQDDRSFDLAGRELYAALYEPGSQYGRPLLGSTDGVRAASREDLLAWHGALVAPENAVIAVVGAIETERAFALLEQALAGAAARPGAAEKRPATPVATPRPKPEDRLLARPREQVCFRLGFVGIPLAHPDFVPLQLGVRLLGTELFFENVYEKGIAYRSWTYLRGGRGPHPFTFEMGVSAPNFKAARAGLEAALRRLVERGPSEEEAARAREEAIARHLLAQQTALGQASLLAGYESLGLGWEHLDRLPELYRKATRDEIAAAIARHLDPARLTIAVVGDLGAAGIATAGEERRRP
jgi:zinc protease